MVAVIAVRRNANLDKAIYTASEYPRRLSGFGLFDTQCAKTDSPQQGARDSTALTLAAGKSVFPQDPPTSPP